MAAIDPTEEPDYADVDDKKPPRATLKIIRLPGDLFGDEDDEDEDEDEEDEEDDDDEDEDDDDLLDA